MHVHDGQLRKIAADAVDVLGVAVGEIRPVAPAAHQEHGDGAVGAVLIDGVQPGIVDIHGDGAAAGFHTRAAQVPVCHRALDFRNSGNGIAAVHTGNAHEAAGLFAHDVHEVVVGDVAHVGALASGHHAQRHARVVHFPVQQVRVALFDGGRHLHQEIVAPALRLFRIAVQVATEVVFQRGTQAGINDSHNDQAPLECFARLGGIVWGRGESGSGVRRKIGAENYGLDITAHVPARACYGTVKPCSSGRLWEAGARPEVGPKAGRRESPASGRETCQFM